MHGAALGDWRGTSIRAKGKSPSHPLTLCLHSHGSRSADSWSRCVGLSCSLLDILQFLLKITSRTEGVRCFHSLSSSCSRIPTRMSDFARRTHRRHSDRSVNCDSQSASALIKEDARREGERMDKMQSNDGRACDMLRFSLSCSSCSTRSLPLSYTETEKERERETHANNSMRGRR